MEIRKTTLLSAMVCVAGVLAEIIFHDIFTTTIIGVVLSVLLSIIILSAVYFVLDGFYSLLKEKINGGEDKKKQGEYEQRIYTILNELLQFEKAIYKEVRALQQMSMDIKTAQSEIKIPTLDMPPEIGEIGDIHEKVRALQQISEEIKAAQSDMAVPMAAVPSDIEGINEKIQILQQISEEVKTVKSELDSVAASVAAVPTEPAQLPPIEVPPVEIPPIEVPPAQISEEALEKLAAAVNENTTMAAKIIVKYVNRNTGELKELLEEKVTG